MILLLTLIVLFSFESCTSNSKHHQSKSSYLEVIDGEFDSLKTVFLDHNKDSLGLIRKMKIMRKVGLLDGDWNRVKEERLAPPLFEQYEDGSWKVGDYHPPLETKIRYCFVDDIFIAIEQDFMSSFSDHRFFSTIYLVNEADIVSGGSTISYFHKVYLTNKGVLVTYYYTYRSDCYFVGELFSNKKSITLCHFVVKEAPKGIPLR